MDTGTHPKLEGRKASPTIPHPEGGCGRGGDQPLPPRPRRLPAPVVAAFSKAHVLMTELSYFLVERVLHNSVNVMTRQREEAGISISRSIPTMKWTSWRPAFRASATTVKSSGAAFHKARSAVLPLDRVFRRRPRAGVRGPHGAGEERDALLHRDVCFHDQTILRSARFEDVKADVLLMETTRGNRGCRRVSAANPRSSGWGNRSARPQAQGQCAHSRLRLGRTQEILALLSLLMKAGKLPSSPCTSAGGPRVHRDLRPGSPSDPSSA